MKRWVTGIAVALFAVEVPGDEMVLTNGTSVTGSFGGFADHRFAMRVGGAPDRREFPASVRSITVDEPVEVSVQLIGARLSETSFTGYSDFSVRFLRDGEDIVRPVTMLKRIDIASDPVPGLPVQAEQTGGSAPAGGSPPVPPERPEAPAAKAAAAYEPQAPASPRQREWRQAGRWREAASTVPVISNGEEVDIAATLKKGAVNVVHFHMVSILSSVRQGNYVEVLASKSHGSVVMRRVVTEWKSPICTALQIDSLPQFWFYSRSGRLCKKLVSRFTDGDIEAAMKEALRSE